MSLALIFSRVRSSDLLEGALLMPDRIFAQLGHRLMRKMSYVFLTLGLLSPLVTEILVHRESDEYRARFGFDPEGIGLSGMISVGAAFTLLFFLVSATCATLAHRGVVKPRSLFTQSRADGVLASASARLDINLSPAAEQRDLHDSASHSDPLTIAALLSPADGSEFDSLPVSERLEHVHKKHLITAT